MTGYSMQIITKGTVKYLCRGWRKNGLSDEPNRLFKTQFGMMQSLKWFLEVYPVYAKSTFNIVIYNKNSKMIKRFIL